MKHTENTGKNADSANDQATGDVKDADGITAVDDKQDAGNDLATGSDQFSEHADDIGRLVKAVDGRSVGNGVPLTGIEIGPETIWDEDKGEQIETGKRLVAWLNNVEAVEPDSIENS